MLLLMCLFNKIWLGENMFTNPQEYLQYLKNKFNNPPIPGKRDKEFDNITQNQINNLATKYGRSSVIEGLDKVTFGDNKILEMG